MTGRYRLQHRVGRGGTAAVYLATDRETGEPVAVKLLELARPDDLERFAREAEVLASLEHPAIVRYLGHGTTPEGRLWLAMQWLEGEDLAQRLERGPLGVDECLVLCTRIAQALSAAHGHGLVHRDVKPGNLFLPGGRIEDVMLVDFGLARRQHIDRQVTRPGVVVGTPGYMAPEQVRSGDQVDGRADLFSLGTVLYECLTGQPAFDAPDPVAILLRVLIGDPTPLRTLAPHVPAPVVELVEGLMAKSRDRRPRSAEEVLERLAGARRALVPPEPVTAGGPITHGELRLQAVVLARLVLPRDPHANTVRLPPTTEAEELMGELQAQALLLGGRVDRLVDGSIVGSVGGAVATDLATAAARLALTLRERFRGWSVTLATGRAELGPEGPSGEVIDRAVALPQETENVRIDELTAELLDRRFELGKDALGHVLRLEREMFDPHRPVLGKSTPFVGREQELLGALGVFEQCVAEQSPRVVLVTGLPGGGKSRLRRELVHRILSRAELLLGRAEPLRAEQPFGLMAPVVRRACGIRATDAPDTQRDRIVARVARTLPADRAVGVAEWLGELAGVPFPDEGRPDLQAARAEPVLKGGRIQRAFETWLGAECEARPNVLVLDDLHWADAASVRLVGDALRRLADRPLFVLALARPSLWERYPDLWRGVATTTTIDLRALSDRAGEHLVRAVLGREAPNDLVRQVVVCGEGNPLLLEELIRATARGEPAGAASSAGAVMQARLESLSSEERRVLRAASVFGRAFWAGGVERLLGGEGPASKTSAILARLAEDELVLPRAESGLGGQKEWRFRHDLLRDAAYATLTADDLARAHLGAAEWLEGRPPRWPPGIRSSRPT